MTGAECFMVVSASGRQGRTSEGKYRIGLCQKELLHSNVFLVRPISCFSSTSILFKAFPGSPHPLLGWWPCGKGIGGCSQKEEEGDVLSSRS